MELNPINLYAATPVFRIFDEERAKDFYLGFLEFTLDWEHRFAEGMPLYMQISCGSCVLHLSEHHGDCCPGSAIRIQVDNIEGFHSKLTLKQYKYAKPGLELKPWNSREVTVTDPFGNRLIFYER